MTSETNALFDRTEAFIRELDASSLGSLSHDAAAQVLRVAAAALRHEDADRGRRYFLLLHDAAQEPFRTVLKQFLDANGVDPEGYLERS